MVTTPGTHDELLERGGIYKTLYERQFRAGTRPKAELVLKPA